MLIGMKRTCLGLLAALALIVPSSAMATTTSVPGQSYKEITGCSQVYVHSIKLNSDDSLFIDNEVDFYLAGSTYSLTVYAARAGHNVVYNLLPTSQLFTVNNQDAGGVTVNYGC